MQKEIKNEKQMIDLGKDIANKLKGGDVVLLYGDLGAGKTTLTKGIASYFGINDVVSPTFTLMQSYQITDNKYQITNFVHIDTYRLENEEDLIEIGAEDYIGDPETVCVIEWPEKLGTLLHGKQTKKITIKHGDNGRIVEIN